MRDSSRLRVLIFALFLLAQGCSPSEDNPSGESKSKIGEAVKEVVTKDFELYKAAKQSLKESTEKSKAQLEMVDQELKSETQ
jgi:hypothetical protein